jgi:hypothetical protein
MNEMYGLLDSLEAVILEGKRVPLTDKIMVDEKRILGILDKVRLGLKSNGSIVKRTVDQSRNRGKSETKQFSVPDDAPEAVTDLLAQAQKEAVEIRDGAKEYADYVIANLQLLVAKMQKNLLKVEKNVDDSRGLLEKNRSRDHRQPIADLGNEPSE